jgi:hypothetical protein
MRKPALSRTKLLRHALPTAVLGVTGVLVIVFAQVGGASGLQNQGENYIPPCSSVTSTTSTKPAPSLAAMEFGNHRTVTVTKYKTLTKTVTKTRTKLVCRTVTVSNDQTVTKTVYVTETVPGTETVTKTITEKEPVTETVTSTDHQTSTVTSTVTITVPGTSTP